MEAEPTHVEKCGMMGSGEIPIEPGDSWFSRNSFRASLKCKSLGGRALIGLGILIGLPNSVKLRMPMTYP